MKDPVLNRPLFRKKAGHVQQIKKNDIPGYVLGGVIAVGSRVIPAARAGIQAFRTAQAGRKAAGTPTMAGKLFQAGKKAVQSPTGQKTIAGLEGASVGLGGAEAYRGLTGQSSLFGDQPASVIGGLGAMAYPGIGGLARTIPNISKSPKLVAAAKKLKGYTPAILPITLVSAGAGLAESGAKESIREEADKRLGKEQFKLLDKQLKDLGDNPTVGQVYDTITDFELTDTQRKNLYDTFGITPQAVDFLEKEKQQVKQGIAPQTPEGTPSDAGENLSGVTPSIGDAAEVVPPNSMNLDEQKRTALGMDRQTKAANKEVKKFESAPVDEAVRTRYLELKNAIQGTTGNQDSTNLLMMKMAAGLLTGKTREGGIAGMLDVAGQALGPTVDTAIVLANQQNEFDRSLALEVIKGQNELEKTLLEKKLEGAGGIKIEKDREFVRVPTNDFIGFDTIEVGKEKDSGRRIQIKPSVNGEIFQQFGQAGTTVKPNPTRQAKIDAAMQDQAIGITMARFVQAAPTSVLGPGASINDFEDKLSGTLSAIGGKFIPGGDIGSLETYNKITQTINDINPTDIDLTDSELEQRQKDANALLKDFQDKEQSIRKKYGDPLVGISDPERKALAQLALIENRMAYLIANANKREDRLTVKDIERAEKRTKILDLFSNPQTIQDNYRLIEKELEKKFEQNAKAYVGQAGGTASFIYNTYDKVPIVAKARRKKEQALQEQEKPGTSYLQDLQGL
jgi:hypothetical protein